MCRLTRHLLHRLNRKVRSIRFLFANCSPPYLRAFRGKKLTSLPRSARRYGDYEKRAYKLCRELCRKLCRKPTRPCDTTKLATKLATKFFPTTNTLTRTLNRTLNRHPCSDTLTRPASTEMQGLPLLACLNDHIDPQILRKTLVGSSRFCVGKTFRDHKAWLMNKGFEYNQVDKAP